MKRTLIAIASVGVLIPAAWVVEANAQQMSPASPPSQAYAPSQMAPTQAYAQQRRVRRSARYARRGAPRPNGGVVYNPGSGPPPYDIQRSASAGAGGAPFEWHAAPGPNRRGNMCVTHTDPLRGYGYQAACKK
jgi:hypothetical protein